MMRERERAAISGWLALWVLLAVFGLGIRGVLSGATGHDPWPVSGWALLVGVDLACLGGLFVVNPNEGRVLQLFGDYRGTVRVPGLRWANPFYSKRAISQRVRNFESSHLKVNDTDGNPIEIAAVVVWKVVDTAEACFEVDNYENYVKVQSEAAVRNLATRYPYDSHDEKQVSLRGSTAAVPNDLKGTNHERRRAARGRSGSCT